MRVLGAIDSIVLIFFIQSPHSALPVAVAIRLCLGHCLNVALLVHTRSMLSVCAFCADKTAASTARHFYTRALGGGKRG